MKVASKSSLFVYTSISALFLAIGISAMGQQKNFIDQPYLEVSGKADTLITPDQIFLSIRLSEKDTKDRLTVEQLEERMVIALEKLGVNTKKDLKVIDVFSNYRDYLLKKTDILKSKRYELEVGTADLATKVLVELESLGISNVNVERLDHTQRKQIEQDVQKRSVIDAQGNAVAIASVLNQKVGLAIHIVQIDDITTRSYSSAQLDEVVVAGYMRGKSYDAAKDITFRQMKLQKAVTVKFILQ